jgi:hypothetical protein
MVQNRRNCGALVMHMHWDVFYRDVKNQVYSRKMKERLMEYDPSSTSQRFKSEVQKFQDARGAAVAQCCNQHPTHATEAQAQAESVQHDHAERDERMLHGTCTVLLPVSLQTRLE